jgi:hypothetical protein
MHDHRNSLIIGRRGRPPLARAGLLGIAIVLALQGRAVQAEQAFPGAANDAGSYKLYCPGNVVWSGDPPNAAGWWACETIQICGPHYGECITPKADK